MSFEPILKELDRISGDPALMSAWYSRNKAAIHEIIRAVSQQQGGIASPIPALAKIVGVQTTLYDNRPFQKAETDRIRYGFQFKVWAGDPAFVNFRLTPPTFSGVGDLLTGEQLVQKAYMLNNERGHFNEKRTKRKNEHRKYPITEDYSVFMEELVEAYPECMFSPVYTRLRGDGTLYHHGQLLRVSISEDRKTITEAELYLTTESTKLSTFRTKNAKGNDLSAPKGKLALLQSRFSPSTIHSGWDSR